MKLPEDRTLCAIGLDWKKQVRRIPLPLRTEWTPTKKKNLVTKMKTTVDLSEPSTFQEAVNGPDQVHWRKAIHAELKSMRLRGVFRAAKLPNGQRAIGTKWVFKIKRKADGSIEKYKARLVAKGFKQKYGIDYTETFSPVVKYVTLRMVIAIAKYFGWPLDQLDVVTAFLYGIMKEQVFCIVPEGVELDGNFDCLELVKAIDGSTQDQQPSINSLKAFYEDEGIEQQTTVPYAHQTNGTAERAIRTIVTIGRSMLHHAKLDKCFWAEAAMTAIYVKNRLPSPKIEHKTPFEIVYKSKPSVKHMRVFGCRTYILTPKEKRLKWDPKARAGIFLGYEEVSKAYRLYDIEAGQVVISRDVNFDESTFGLSPRISDEDVDGLDVDSLDIDDDGPRQTEYKQTGKRKSRPSDEDEATRRPHTVRHQPGLEEASAPDSSSSSHRVDTDEEEKSGDQDEESTPPVFWRASANAVEATVDLSEPSTFQEAVNGPDQVHWRKAIHAELKSMRLRGVFRAAKLPNGQRAIGTKWVFKIKRKADGSIEKYKARLVAKGFKQNT
ncbi:hypothetical protein PC122_g24260 [Phytophthora cactorum]|nr:hypothetical protein PC122_g24260 [Phytophthora cactorum]